MDIPVNVDVHCTDGLCGRSTYVLINPVHKKVTHLVIQETEPSHIERVVPIEAVSETTHDVILLRYSRDELTKMDPFIQREYIRDKIPDPDDVPIGYIGTSPFLLWPYRVPERTELVTVAHKQIPRGELAIRRGTQVEATDGRVGHVDEFLINPENDHITHLVMREGHLWGQKDVTIPVSEIDRIEEDIVYLKLDKDEVEALPAIPTHRWKI